MRQPTEGRRTSCWSGTTIGRPHPTPRHRTRCAPARSPGQEGGSTNTDTMVVLHVPAGGGAPTMISFPRDSWVDIPGVGKGKLNSAFADGAAKGGGDAGGMGLLITTLEKLSGL